MDSITQAALGAALGGAIAGKTLGRSALAAGAVLGTLPDLDVLINYGSAVANFTQHRGFSHSLLVLIPLAGLLGLALYRWRPQVSPARWMALSTAVLVTHPLLDCLTTYGTQLWWPLAPPVALHSIFIIDPMYTLPLLIPLAYTLWRPTAIAGLTAGLAVSTLYLGWSLLAQQLVIDRIAPVLTAEGLDDAPRMVQPMPFSTILWRVTVLAPERRLEMVTGLLDGDQPPSQEWFPFDGNLAQVVASFPEGRRLQWFTRGFLAYEQREDLLTATDIRLGIPGAHPFTFALARRNGDGWEPVPSYQLPRPALASGTANALWQRITGAKPVLCLATLETRAAGQSC